MRNKKNIISLALIGNNELGGPLQGVGDFMNPTKTGLNRTLLSASIGKFLSTAITSITIVAGLAFALFFIIGGLKWAMAGGDKGKVTEAQSQMTQSALGLIVVIVSYFIVGLVGTILGINILNPGLLLGL